LDVDSARREVRAGAIVPDVVLMDYHLKGDLTGLSALETISLDIGEPVAAILVTANYTDSVREAAQARGYPVLHKPVRPGALRALMAQLTASRRRGETRADLAVSGSAYG
jgi:CheY-like chemotaxis protein